MKQENENLSRQCEELKAHLDATDKRISSSISTCSSGSTGRSDDASRDSQNKDIATLKDRNHALERKLKKYHSHCAKLEDEIATGLKVLESCLPVESSKGLNKAIIALCEKVSSLEDECNLQEEAKKMTSAYAREVDELRCKASELEAKFSESENRISILSRSEKDLQTKLKYTREELLSLRQKHDDSERSTQENENDKSRQISYLERENLQLHKELKAAKGLLRNAVNQTNTVQLALQNPMIDVQQLAACSPLKSLQAMKDSITNKSPDAHSSYRPSPRISPNKSARKRSMGIGYENKRDSAEKRGENDENTMECNPS